MYKNKITISALIIFALVFFVVIVLLYFFSNERGEEGLPTPSPVIKSGEEEAEPGYEFTSQDKEKSEQSFLVGQLIGLLPYSGTNFSFYYDFSKNQFILYINPSASSQGNAEFDAFLRQNGVEDRSWIENLVSTGEKATPAP